MPINREASDRLITETVQRTQKKWTIPDGESGIVREELLARLQHIGVPIPITTLRYWEYKGMLPRPDRTWRDGKGNARYPLSAVDSIREVWIDKAPSQRLLARLASFTDDELSMELARRKKENL